jgi:ribosome-associated toxin RatA of RatAB toxin-antitoxin module
MKRFWKITKRTLLIIAGVIVLFFAVLLTFGAFADIHYEGTETKTIAGTPEQVWSVLTDVERYSGARHEVKRVEILPVDEKGLKAWREHTNIHGAMTYQVLEEIPREKMTIQMVKSDFGLSGVWTFNLEEKNGETVVSLREVSDARDLLMRSILNAIGRNGNQKLLLMTLDKEVKKS